MILRDIDRPIGRLPPPHSGKRLRLFFLVFFSFFGLSLLCVFLFLPGLLFTHREPLAVNTNVPRSMKMHEDAALHDRLRASSPRVLPAPDATGRVVSLGKTRPFDLYARPFAPVSGAKIALVIGGLGVSQTTTSEAIALLPSEVTLAFAPHGNSLARWTSLARQEGHEFILQLPLEPFDYPRINPGSNTLRVNDKEEVRLDKLEKILGRAQNYMGVMNYMGGRFTSDEPAVHSLMEELGRRGLFFLDDGTSPRSLAPQLALQKDVPFARADLVIDVFPERADVLKSLQELEKIAQSKGFAIGMGSAFELTLEVLKEWFADIAARNVHLVPLSILARDPRHEDAIHYP